MPSQTMCKSWLWRSSKPRHDPPRLTFGVVPIERPSSCGRETCTRFPRGGLGVRSMADSGPMFRLFYGNETWREAVVSRAWELYTAWPPHYMQPTLFACILFTLAVGFGLLTETDLVASLKQGVLWVVTFGSWFLIYVVLSAKDVYYKQVEKIEALETALANRAALPLEPAGVTPTPSPGQLLLQGHPPEAVIRDALLESLIQLRIAGVKLRNEKFAVDQEDDWRRRVDQWKHDALNAIRHRANIADVARFEVLDRVPVMDFKWARGGRHRKTLRELSRRIEILLEIMAKIGEPTP